MTKRYIITMILFDILEIITNALLINALRDSTVIVLKPPSFFSEVDVFYVSFKFPVRCSLN